VALGSTRQLGYLNLLGWVSVGAAVACAAVGAPWGLKGVLYGVAVGWLVRTIAGAVLAWPHLRSAS